MSSRWQSTDRGENESLEEMMKTNCIFVKKNRNTLSHWLPGRDQSIASQYNPCEGADSE